MAKKVKQSMADLGAVLRAAKTATPQESGESSQQKRQLVADLCRLLGARTLTGEAGRQRSTPCATPPQTQQMPALSPRMRQTLERLLAGDSEKQIAAHLGVSKHTVHVYVKALYRGFSVCSRGELLARFVQAPTFSPSRPERG